MTRTARTLTFLLASLLILAGCSSSSSGSSNSGFVEFKDHGSWDFAKQQRWQRVQSVMAENASEAIDNSQAAAITEATASHWTAQQLQNKFDGLEQRRTGNPAAKSCRMVTDVKRPYDIKHCNQLQLAAEIFQGIEELNGRN